MLALAKVAVTRTREVVPREVRELLAVLLTAGLHLSWPLTGLSRGWLVIPLVVAWGAHVVLTARRDPTALDGWGLRWEGLRPTALAVVALIGLAGPVMAISGLIRGADPSPWMWVAVAAYPVWGLVQQLLVQGVVTRGLSKLPRPFGSPVLATLGSAIAFGLAHWPDPVLMAATFGLGLVLAPIWLRWRNLWPLAFAHGWLGTLLYYFVMLRDPMSGYLGG